jgi:hypothetical protein
VSDRTHNKKHKFAPSPPGSSRQQAGGLGGATPGSARSLGSMPLYMTLHSVLSTPGTKAVDDAQQQIDKTLSQVEEARLHQPGPLRSARARTPPCTSRPDCLERWFVQVWHALGEIAESLDAKVRSARSITDVEARTHARTKTGTQVDPQVGPRADRHARTRAGACTHTPCPVPTACLQGLPPTWRYRAW